LRFGVISLELLVLGLQRLVTRGLLLAHRLGLAGDPAHPIGVPVGEVGRDLDPSPAFAADRLGLPLEFLAEHALEQARILQPAAIV
jgi:hypothetical protein